MARIELPLHVVRRAAVAVAVAVALVAGGLYGCDRYRDGQARCADGVVERDGECVGVTDGAYTFAPHLADVTAKIREENALVEKEKGDQPYVSVAYLTSFTLTDDDSNSEDSVRHELEGAYLAQYRHNRGDLNATPKIRLLIANSGSRSAHWEHTVGELVASAEGPQRLVAVTGLGPSTSENVTALRTLSEAGLATVASTMTATSIRNIPGFVRAAPTNVDEARAAVAYLKREKRYGTAVVVQDAAKRNLYASTLGAAFTEAYPDARHRLVRETRTFDSSVPDAWPNELRFIPGDLCEAKPRLVYFAGRGRHLTHFLDALANRPCQEQKFTVMAGDDTTNLEPDELAAAAASGVEMLYTGLAHTDMWQRDPSAVSGPSARHFRPGGLLDRWFPADPRYDGQDIMAHDAVLTAAQGVRMASGWRSEVTGPAVGRMFQQMGGGQQVPGASGFLSFGADGNPKDKAVPIMKLTPTGRSELIDVSAPAGRPAGER
ncbi:ABC transporter substrate-binding protein [Streptomyces sp. NPDC060194]|uniref:ABC transporter substrate-binding protein n=1 Tax=Streptomyces sp. NPDC060194 TaxID=3347069 RepID=UPI00365EEA20